MAKSPKQVLKNIKENAKNKNYPPPQDGIVFVRMWNALINQVVNHSHFNPDFHLANLETLCSLYQTEKELMDFIRVHGSTYEVDSRKVQGIITKSRPENQMLNTTRAQIRSYCKALGLDLDRKTKHKGPKPETELNNEWK